MLVAAACLALALQQGAIPTIPKSFPEGTNPLRDAVLVGETAYVMGLPVQLNYKVESFDWIDANRAVFMTYTLSREPDEPYKILETTLWLYRIGQAPTRLVQFTDERSVQLGKLLRGDVYTFLTSVQKWKDIPNGRRTVNYTTLVRMRLSTRTMEAVFEREMDISQLTGEHGSDFVVVGTEYATDPSYTGAMVRATGPATDVPGGFVLEGKLLVNRQTGNAMDPLTRKPALFPAGEPPRAPSAIPGVTTQYVVGRSGTNQDPVIRNELWLAAEAPDFPNRAAIVFDGQGRVWLGAGAIAYLDRQILYVRPIFRVPRKEFLEAAAAAEAIELTNIVKQMGTAIAIYLSDNDDKLPSSANFYEAIRPYNKNDIYARRYRYLLDSSLDVTKVEDVSKKEMGFIQGRFGRAVGYLDTSARWIPNP